MTIETLSIIIILLTLAILYIIGLVLTSFKNSQPKPMATRYPIKDITTVYNGNIDRFNILQGKVFFNDRFTINQLENSVTHDQHTQVFDSTKLKYFYFNASTNWDDGLDFIFSH